MAKATFERLKGLVWTYWVEIWFSHHTGNHAQFGWHGDDKNEPATLSREEQQAQIIDATVAILNYAETQ